MRTFSHDELEACGLPHGTGAICCGCSSCHCFNCWLKRSKEVDGMARKRSSQKKGASGSKFERGLAKQTARRQRLFGSS